MSIKMKHFNWMRLLIKLCWWCFIFFGLMICPCSAPVVNTNCSTLVYAGCESASVTCFFSHDLRPILKDYGGYLMEHKTEDGVRRQVIESYWITPDQLQYVVKEGYNFNSDEITDSLTVHIPQFTDRFKGAYHCSLFPPHKGKDGHCRLDAETCMVPSKPVCSTARTTTVLSTQTLDTSTETRSDSTSDSELVLKIVLPVLSCIIVAALVLIWWRRRKPRRRPSK